LPTQRQGKIFWLYFAEADVADQDKNTPKMPLVNAFIVDLMANEGSKLRNLAFF
jgi:hypothetical protein